MQENPNEADENVPTYSEAPIIDPNSLVSLVLRELYDSVQNEAIPDRFLDLLEKLDMVESAAKSGDSQ